MTEYIPYGDHLRSYLSDESRLGGSFDRIAFPDSADDMAAAVRDLISSHTPFTLQGARTGISGAAVPAGGTVISTEKLTAIYPVSGGEGSDPTITVSPISGDTAPGPTITVSPISGGTGPGPTITVSPISGGTGPGPTITVESGARLESIRTTINSVSNSLVFAPNPTEETATAGGLFAAGAYGSNSFRYGSFADHVTAADILLANGELMSVRRGDNIFTEDGCSLPGGRFIAIPEYHKPSGVCSFTPRPGTDLLDLFAGSEGMFGVAVRLTLKLSPVPPEPKAVLFFFRDKDEGAAFASGTAAKNETRPDFVEYLDQNVLMLLERQKSGVSKLKELPSVPEGAVCAVYTELTHPDSADAESWLMDRLLSFEKAGGREEDTWAAFGAYEASRFKSLRHAVPELINTRIDAARRAYPGAVKTCIDYSVPDSRFDTVLARSERAASASGVEHYIFGHAAENRLHVNFIPKDDGEALSSDSAIRELCRFTLENGGFVFPENGIGRIKAALFKELIPPGELAMLRGIKDFFDPERLFCPNGVL